MPVNDKIEAIRTRKAKRLPTVLSRDEVGRLLDLLQELIKLWLNSSTEAGCV